MAQKKATKRAAQKTTTKRRAATPAKRGAARPGKPKRPAEKAPAAKASPKRRAPKRRAQPETLRLKTLSVSLTVDNVERSLRFYRDGLGFVVADRWEEGGELVGYMLRAGSCEIGIGRDDWAKGRGRTKGTAIRLWCETSQDIDAFAARVRAHGYALTEPPTDHAWGVRAFAVDDPDGFHLSIYRKLATD